MDLRLFFSWQSSSDTNKLHQRRFITQCIQTAIAQVNKELKYVNIIYQDSTRGISGTPEIIPEIEERIKKCHIFVGDFTLIQSGNESGNRSKPHPNLNVVFESGFLLARPFMEFQSFFVQNSIFGNPRDDVREMFSDFRGRRFPISFSLNEYNENTPKDNYKEEQKKFILALKEAISECAKSAVFHLEEDIKPFYNWEGHKNISGFEGGYISNGLESYLKLIKENKDNLRITGLSGLGKTRMVLEAFKDKNIRFLYAYIDCQEYKHATIIDKVSFMIEHYKEMVLVFDNCDMELHDRIVRIKRSNHAFNPIITIYNNPNENATPYSKPLKLQNDLTEVVEKILDRYSESYDSKDKNILLDFAGGIPMMAQLLVDGLREGYPKGVVNDSILMNKILATGEDTNDRKIIRSISLFDYIGFSGERRNEMQFIAGTKAITCIDEDKQVLEYEFDRVVNKYLGKRILELKGRLVGVRPIPIAIYLISEWIEQCSAERILDVIKAIQESEMAQILTNSFANQFRYMGYNEKACDMLNKLLGEKSPFSNAEVINTDLGSRLFRSFVEVNPEAVASCLWNVIGGMSVKSLEAIDESRRNLVWTIEKLCFEPTTFEKGAEMMLMLGLAENEQISNNATGQFTALFSIYLPATAVSLNNRLRFLNKQKQYTERHPLLMNALNRALNTRDFFYFTGPEQRGLEQLSNYEPKTYNEILEYVNGCLELLMNIIEDNNSQLDKCCEILENNLGCLCYAGYGSQVMSCIQKVAIIKNKNWEKMLDALRFVTSHENIKLSNELRIEIEKMISELSNDDFFFRFSQVEKKNKWISNKNSYDEILNRNNEEYEKLAIEMASNSKLYSIEVLKKVYSFDGYYGNTFGSIVAKSMNKNSQEEFIRNSLDAFQSLEKYKYSIFIDFIRQVDEDMFAFAFEGMKLLHEKAILFACVASRNYKFNDVYPEKLYQMVKESKAEVGDYEQFLRFMQLNTHTEDEMLYLFQRILSLPNSLKTIVHMSKMLFIGGFQGDTTKIRNFIEEVILKKFDEFPKLAKCGDYWDILIYILDKGSKEDFAKGVLCNIFQIIDNPSTIYYRNYWVESCMKLLIRKYFDVIWSELSKALLSSGEKYMLYYNLKSILNPPTNFNDEVGILFETNHNKELFEWCAKHPNIAPERLMLMAPLFKDNQFSEIVIKLLDLYGNQESVLDALSYNMSTFSFIGSIVPLYERQYKCISHISNHNIEEVRLWAVKMMNSLKCQIEDEKNRDAEDGYTSI